MSTNHSLLRKYLTTKRFKHSLEVARISQKIAEYYNYKKPENAYIAGLYHDIAKDMSTEELLATGKKYKYRFTSCELNSPATLHAPVSMLITKYELDITDRDILMAIKYHTTGRMKMSLLEKIVYLADIVEIGKKIDHALIVKKLVYSNINEAVKITARETLKHLLEKEKVICTKSLQCYNYYSMLAD
ncbi:MAG: bis(5'-nucleosyl)-tetraphosphatase (symmetrical) YqeK [Candidatus Margulisbacteria bacterium]|nr:bis(5'-nucleosyl)-tetraphosphatase (symmetrical) YqeK [Candidatus Margulisiibacteriota bacterium]